MPPRPAPAPHTAREAAPLPRRGWRVLGGVALAGGIALGAALGGFDTRRMLAGGDRPMSDSEAAGRAATFAAAGPLLLAEVPPEARAAALAGMGLAPNGQADLARTLAQDGARLVLLELWDDRDEDGDAVRVVTAGYGRDVTLRHVSVQLTVPVAAGEPIRLVGTEDGGGGITVAVRAGGRAVPLPRLAVGETLALAVR